MTPDEIEARRAENNIALATAQNIAANGRLFCALLFVACLNMQWQTPGTLYMRIGLFSILPIGLSCIADRLPAGKTRSNVSVAIYTLAAVSAFAFAFSLLFVG